MKINNCYSSIHLVRNTVGCGVVECGDVWFCEVGWENVMYGEARSGKARSCEVW